MARQTNTMAIIVILALTIVALAFLVYGSFGNGAAIGTYRPNPSSQQPAARATGNGTLMTFNNLDVPENHYTIQVPADWQVQPAAAAGTYGFRVGDATSMVELMDVPDNSNLALYVLSQVEPKLRSTVDGYQQVSYVNTTVNGAEAYTLTYRSSQQGTPFTTMKTFIAGSDHAALITISAPAAEYATLQPIITKTINSFSWRNP